MSGRTKFYITTAISYPNGVPHIGHAYEAIATDVIARFERLDGKDVFFLTGTDEHGLKMKQTAVKEGLTPRALADRNSARFVEMVKTLDLSNDDFIRTTEERHYEASAEIWRRMEAAGDIFKKKYGGWYSVRDETYYKESETEVRDGARYRDADRNACRMERGGDLLLPPLRLSGQAARSLREEPGLHPAARAEERGRELRQRRPRGSVDLALDAGLGHSRSGCAGTRHVRLGRCAHQLRDGDRAPQHAERRARRLLAGRRPRHRQGHRALPRRLLAGLPDERRHRAAEARIQPRLRAEQGREDVEVGRQRRRPVRSRQSLRRRSGALLLPARGHVRAGRQLQPGGHRQPHQCGSGEQPRQPGPALAVDDLQELRRQDPDARRLERNRHRHPGTGRCALRAGPRGHG